MDRIQHYLLWQKLAFTPAQRERYKELEIVDKLGEGRKSISSFVRDISEKLNSLLGCMN